MAESTLPPAPPRTAPPGARDDEPGVSAALLLRVPVEGTLLGAGVGVVVGGGLGGLVALLGGLTAAGSGAEVLTGMAGMLLVGLALGAAAGAATGLAAAAAVVAGLGVAWSVLRCSRRRLTRRSGTVVVPLSVLSAPLMAAVVVLASGVEVEVDQALRLAATAAATGFPALLVGSALATWRYRRLTSGRRVSRAG